MHAFRGQRQRLCLARAIIKQPTLLILDEPTASVDAESTWLIDRAIERLQSGKTTLVIAHHFHDMESFDRILVLRDGAIAEQGTHRDLLRLGGYYAELHRLQSGKDDKLSGCRVGLAGSETINMRTSALLSTILFTSGLAFSQDTHNREGVPVRGTVHDASGAALPKAKLKLKLSDRRDEEGLKITAESGVFVFENVLPGDYVLKTEAKRFRNGDYQN